jgi:hypothetical protein
MAGGEKEARGILDEPSILKRNAHREKNRPESAPIAILGPESNLAHKSFENGAGFPVFCHHL